MQAPPIRPERGQLTERPVRTGSWLLATVVATLSANVAAASTHPASGAKPLDRGDTIPTAMTISERVESIQAKLRRAPEHAPQEMLQRTAQFFPNFPNGFANFPNAGPPPPWLNFPNW